MSSYDWVDALDFLEALEVRNISQSGGELNFSCPSDAHAHGDARPSARMNVETALWICHGCGARGTPVDFLVQFRSMPETTAARILSERYGGPHRVAIDGLTAEVKRIMAPAEIVLERSAPDESWVQKFCAGIHWPDIQSGKHYFPPGYYMLERGFSPEHLDLWEIGYDEISGRVTIPVRDIDDRLVGFKGRDWTGEREPKYLIIGDAPQRTPRYGFDTYRKSEHVFGLGAVRKLHQEGFGPRWDVPTDMIIVEGELNVIAMWQHGHVNTVGVAGSEFSERQRQLICEHARGAIVFFDNDEAGSKGAAKVVDALSPYIPVSIVMGARADAAELTALEVAELIDDAQPSLTLRLRARGLAL